MSWDHNYYEATCKKCGKKGYRIESSDDWGHSEVSWEGFAPYTEFSQHSYLVGRRRIDPNHYAKCDCGSTNIEVSRTLAKSL